MVLYRSVCQVIKYRIYVCPLHPRSVACSFVDLEESTIPSSFPQTPPPFMHSSLHTSPSTPSVTSLTITGSSQLQNGCGLELPKKIRQEYGVYTEIRRILPYIRRINTEIRKYGIRIRRGETGKIRRIYLLYIRIIIQIRIWPTLVIYGVYIMYTVLANPTRKAFELLCSSCKQDAGRQLVGITYLTSHTHTQHTHTHTHTPTHTHTHTRLRLTHRRCTLCAGAPTLITQARRREAARKRAQRARKPRGWHMEEQQGSCAASASPCDFRCRGLMHCQRIVMLL